MQEKMTKQDAIEYLLYMKHDVQAKSPMDIALDTAIEALKQPTIEPEVRHGRWIVNGRNPDYVDCTNCGLSEWIGANGSRAYAETLLSGFKKYCPNCGARMDAEKEVLKMLEPIKTLCKYCKYYEPVKGKRHGYCRKPYSYYDGLKINGSHKGADRCFEKRGAENVSNVKRVRILQSG